MTDWVSRYDQDEKEVIALTWPCDRVIQYTTVVRVLLEIDHMPLIPLLDFPIKADDLTHVPERIYTQWMRSTDQERP